MTEQQLRKFIIENCSQEMAGCDYKGLTNIAKLGIDNLVDNILMPAIKSANLL